MRVCCWAFHLVIARVARWGELGEESKRTNVRKDADIKATATNFGSDLNRAEIPEEELTQAISNIKQLIQELKIGEIHRPQNRSLWFFGAASYCSAGGIRRVLPGTTFQARHPNV